MKKLFIIIVLLIVVLALSKGRYSAGELHKENYVYHSHLISKGETLWSLAEERVLPGDDIREYINCVMYANNMKYSTIYSGQYIILLEPIRG